MPEGAQSRDLENLTRFRTYLTANIDSWYRFANGPRGRDARNGDLRLVVGYDNATSWGMAAFSGSSGASQPDCRLHFKSSLNPESDPSVSSYTWEHSGLVEARAGPDPEEMALLREGDLRPPRNGKYVNQTLFIRTLNATLGDDLWENLCHELGTAHLVDEGPPSNGGYDNTSFPHASHSNDHASSASTNPGHSASGGRWSHLQSNQDNMERTTMSAHSSSGTFLNISQPLTAMVRKGLACYESV